MHKNKLKDKNGKKLRKYNYVRIINIKIRLMCKEGSINLDHKIETLKFNKFKSIR